jgi:O-antigen/teichoic acid export membrane protein
MFNNLVVKYSKKLGLDLKYFLNNGVWTSSYIFIDLILGFLFSLVLIKYLNQEELGLWYWYVSIFSICSIFTLSGFNLIIRKCFIEGIYKAYSRLFWLRISISSIGTLILFLTAYCFFIFKSETHSNFFIIMGLALPISNLRFYVDYLYSKDNFKKISQQAIFKYLAYYIISITLIILDYSLLIIFISYLFIQYIIDLILSVYYYKKIILCEKLKNNKELYSKGYTLSCVQILPLIGSQIDKLIIPIILTVKDLAVYGIALIVPNAINSINKKLIFNILFKKINNLKISELKQVLHKNLFKIIFIYIIYFIILTGLSYIIFKFIINVENFNRILLYSELLLSISFISLFVEFFKKIIESRTDIKSLFNYELQTNITLIILQIISIYMLGVIGAILTKLVMECFKLCILYNKIKKIN